MCDRDKTPTKKQHQGSFWLSVWGIAHRGRECRRKRRQLATRHPQSGSRDKRFPVVGAPAGGMVLPFSVDLPSSRSEPQYAHSGAQRLVYLVTLELVKLTTSIVTVTVWLSKKMLSLTGP